jgi:hypothetical protein
MERLWTYGNAHILKHNDMTFIAFNNILSKPTIDIIGCYKDKNDIVKRIRRESVYGKMVLEVLDKEK